MLETIQKQKLRVDDIRLFDPKHPIEESKVNLLIHSIEDKGLITPVAVNKDNQLIAGYHRLEAFRRLYHQYGSEYEWIPVRVVSEDDGVAMKQLDTTEKLFRNDLSILEKAEHFKHYFDQLKYGENRHKTTAIFKTLDISRRTFFNLRTIADHLSDAVKQKIKRLPQLENSTQELLTLCKFDEKNQITILERYENGGFTSIFEVIKGTGSLEYPPEERKFKAKKFLQTPNFKVDKHLREEILQVAKAADKDADDLFQEVLEAGLELVQRKYV